MDLNHQNILLSLFSILYFCNHLSNSFIMISTGIYILVYIFFSKDLFLDNNQVINNFVSISLYIIFNLFSFVTSLISLLTIGDKENRIFTNIPIKRTGHILTLIYLIIGTIYCVYKIINLEEEDLKKVRFFSFGFLLLVISSIFIILYPSLNVFTNNYKCHNLSEKNITQSFKCNTFLT